MITDTEFGVSEAHHPLAADGSFAVTGLSPITVRLHVLLANKRYAVAPGEFDLRLGGHRGLVLLRGATAVRGNATSTPSASRRTVIAPNCAP